MGMEKMKAVVYEGPFNISVKEMPMPTIVDKTDAILKVHLAGVCGSDLHMYRGHQKSSTGHIMGHEFVGTIERVGTDVSRFKVGQKVMSIFSPMCMECWFCEHGYTNRCVNGPSFGSALLAGGQAEYVRVPYADSTLEFIPPEVSDDMMIIMCDIFPTGYYASMRALTKLIRSTETAASIFNEKSHAPLVQHPVFRKQRLDEIVVACLGCGPVGLCAILTAKFLGVGTVYAVDSVKDRLEEARKMGGLPVDLEKDDVLAVIKSATGGRGADAVVESVGNQSAMRLAFDLVRTCGVISSIGFHQSELPFTGFEAYSKNLDIHMGRAAVRPVFGEALEVFAANQDKFSDFVTHRMPLQDARLGYELFEKHQARKVVLTL